MDNTPKPHIIFTALARLGIKYAHRTHQWTVAGFVFAFADLDRAIECWRGMRGIRHDTQKGPKDDEHNVKEIDLKEYARLRSIVQRTGILVATWIAQEDDWLYDSYESPETERGARDAILCAAEAVRKIFEEYKKEIEP